MSKIRKLGSGSRPDTVIAEIHEDVFVRLQAVKDPIGALERLMHLEAALNPEEPRIVISLDGKEVGQAS